MQPGFSSPVRDRIRGDTDAANESLGERREANFAKGGGRALGEVVSDVAPHGTGRIVANSFGAVFDREGFHPETAAVAQNAGGRLARRYRD